MATVQGFAKLLLFFGLWCASGLVPLVLIHSLATARPWPLLAAAAWWAYRLLNPARPWAALRRAFSLDDTPYFAAQRLVFAAEGSAAASPPARGARRAADGERIPADDARMLCFHPHGMLCCGWTVANSGAALAAARVTWLAADALMLLPGIGDFLRWNATEGVGAANLRRLMARRANVALLPGGFEEATLYSRGAFRVYIRGRKGFIKFALQHGYAVHPVFTFGEERTFHAFTPLRAARLALNRLRLPAVLFLGTPRLAALPFLPDPSAELHTVVGPPLRLPRTQAPSPADVALWHGRYCDALQRLFDEHKREAGVPDAVLEML